MSQKTIACPYCNALVMLDVHQNNEMFRCGACNQSFVLQKTRKRVRRSGVVSGGLGFGVAGHSDEEITKKKPLGKTPPLAPPPAKATPETPLPATPAGYVPYPPPTSYPPAPYPPYPYQGGYPPTPYSGYYPPPPGQPYLPPGQVAPYPPVPGYGETTQPHPATPVSFPPPKSEVRPRPNTPQIDPAEPEVEDDTYTEEIYEHVNDTRSSESASESYSSSPSSTYEAHEEDEDDSGWQPQRVVKATRVDLDGKEIIDAELSNVGASGELTEGGTSRPGRALKRLVFFTIFTTGICASVWYFHKVREEELMASMQRTSSPAKTTPTYIPTGSNENSLLNPNTPVDSFSGENVSNPSAQPAAPSASPDLNQLASTSQAVQDRLSRGRNPENRSTANAQEIRLAREAVLNYFNAETVEQKRAFVRNPDTEFPLMQHYYANQPSGKVQYQSLADIPVQAVNTGEFGFEVEFKNGERRMIGVQKDSASGEYKIDWQSFVIYSDVSWDELISSRPTKPVMLRVKVYPDDYYNLEFANSQEYQCYRIEDPKGNPEPLYVYAKRTSDIGETLRKLEELVPPETPIPLVIRAAFLPNSQSPNQLSLVELVSNGWMIRKKPNLE